MILPFLSDTALRTIQPTKRVKTKNHLFALFLLLSTLAFSQDPSCEYQATFRNVQTDLYDYLIIVDDENTDRSIRSIQKSLRKHWGDGNALQTALLRSETGKEILLGYRFYYCYPRYENTDQLRIVIARKDKQSNRIDLMFSSAPLRPGRTRIEVPGFQTGKRPCEVYEPLVSSGDQRNKRYTEADREMSGRLVVVN